MLGLERDVTGPSAFGHVPLHPHVRLVPGGSELVVVVHDRARLLGSCEIREDGLRGQVPHGLGGVLDRRGRAVSPMVHVLLPSRDPEQPVAGRQHAPVAARRRVVTEAVALAVWHVHQDALSRRLDVSAEPRPSAAGLDERREELLQLLGRVLPHGADDLRRHRQNRVKGPAEPLLTLVRLPEREVLPAFREPHVGFRAHVGDGGKLSDHSPHPARPVGLGVDLVR